MSKNIAQIYAANPSTTILGTDLIYIGKSPFGAGNNSAILWSNVLLNVYSPANSVYVAKNGIDATGRGSFTAPFLTIAYAMSTISTATSSDPFTIFVANGTYAETAISFIPFVNIRGNGQTSTYINITTCSLSSSFLSTSLASVEIESASVTGLSLNFSTASVSTFFRLNDVNTGSISLTNTSGSAPFFLMNNGLNQGTFISTGSIGIIARNYSLNGTVSLSKSIVDGSVCEFDNCTASQFNIDSNVLLTLNNTHSNSGVAISGTTATLSTDMASYCLYSFSSGATLSQVNVTSELPTPKNLIYVDKNGNDSSGDGSFFKPYLTRARAITQASTMSATATSPVGIMYGEGTWTESTASILPWVQDIGVSRESTFLNVTTWSFSSSYLATNAPTSTFNNISFTSLFSIDFSSYTGTGSPALHFYATTFNALTLNSSAIQNARIRVWSSRVLNNLSNTGNCTLLFYYTNINGGLTFSNPNNTGAATQFVSCILSSAAVSQYGSVILFNTRCGSSIGLDGVNSTAFTDLASYCGFTYSGGASGTSGQVVIDSAAGEPPFASLNSLTAFTVYVSKSGNDSNVGSINSPLLTLQAAIALITTASVTDIYTIAMAPGTYSETFIGLKPFINIRGSGVNSTIITGTPVTLDATVLSTNNGTISIDNVTITSSSSFNWTGITASATSLNINNTNFTASVSFINTTTSVAPHININSSYFYGNVTNSAYAITSIYKSIFLASYINNSSSFGSLNKIYDCILTTLTLSNASSVYSTNSTITNVSISGVNSALFTDSIDFPTYTFSSGASIGNVALTNSSKALASAYVPTNYTATDTTVWGALSGIDAKLATYLGNIRYVAINGSDSNNGSINSPYLTIDHAYAQITTASASNPFVISVSPGVYTSASTTISVDPYIALIGQTSGSCTIRGITFVQSSKWLLTGTYYGCIKNVTLENGAIDLNFTSASATTINISIQSIQTNNLPIKLTGTSTNIVNVKCFDNSFNEDISYFGVTDIYAQSNIYTLSLNVGENTTTPGAACYFVQINDFLNNGTQVYFNAITDSIFAQIYGTINQAGINTDGSMVTLTFDAPSYTSVFPVTGTPTINLSSLASGVKVEFSATNYSPVNNSVEGNLQGINNLLGTIVNIANVSVTGTTITLSPNVRYFCNAGASLITYTLPATTSVGDQFIIVGGASGLFTVHQLAGQQIICGANITTAGTGGSITSTNIGDGLVIMTRINNTGFIAYPLEGTFTVV